MKLLNGGFLEGNVLETTLDFCPFLLGQAVQENRIAFKCLVEYADYGKRGIGTAIRQLSKLLEQVNVCFFRMCSGEFERLAQLINDQHDATITRVNDKLQQPGQPMHKGPAGFWGAFRFHVRQTLSSDAFGFQVSQCMGQPLAQTLLQGRAIAGNRDREKPPASI